MRAIEPGASPVGGPASELDARFSAAGERGRKLVSNHDGTVLHDPPFVLACECSGHALDLAVRRVSLFALALSSIITGIVVSGAAPLPILLIAIVWAAAALGARLFARSRRRQHGRVVVDFERDELIHAPPEGPAERLALAGSRVALENSVDESAPFWIVLTAPSGARVRLARGRSDELRRVVQLFKSYQYDVDARAIDEERSDDA